MMSQYHIYFVMVLSKSLLRGLVVLSNLHYLLFPLGGLKDVSGFVREETTTADQSRVGRERWGSCGEETGTPPK